MKVLVMSALCALVSCVAGGAVAWPGAIAVSSPFLKTIIPGETKTTAYSTTQYINAVPTSYAFAGQPQFAFHQVPQVNSFASLQPAYYPVAEHSYIPASSIYYPSTPSFAPVFGSGISTAPAFPGAPATPSAPAYPEGSQSAPPSQQAGDADTAVIDSADFNADQQRQQNMEPGTSSPSQPPAPAEPQFPPFPPSNTFPNFPPIPQIPQGSGQAPSLPQFPQIPGIPQFPQIPGIPQYPQNPPESTQAPPSSYPAPTNDDRNLNDEDTVSVESA